MIARITFIALILAYVAIIIPFSTYMKDRPVAVKLGYLPEAKVLKTTLADYRNLLAQSAVVKVLFYYGTLVEKFEHKVKLQPEYFNMFKMLQTAVRLDPYNMDAYYFAEAAFTWELKRIMEVNDLLDYGMEYRTWDYQLPFFAGFNAAYFQKDYTAAAKYMKKAAELTHDPLFTNLAARYFYEAGSTDLGLLFLDNMAKGEKDEKVRKMFLIRREALLGVKIINRALEKYRSVYGRNPSTIRELLTAGFLDKVPNDPYGGSFYLSEDGSVRTTRKFAFAGKGADGKRQ